MPWNAGARPVARTASHTPAAARERALVGLSAYVRKSTRGVHADTRGAGGALSTKPMERPAEGGALRKKARKKATRDTTAYYDDVVEGG